MIFEINESNGFRKNIASKINKVEKEEKKAKVAEELADKFDDYGKEDIADKYRYKANDHENRAEMGKHAFGNSYRYHTMKQYVKEPHERHLGNSDTREVIANTKKRLGYGKDNAKRSERKPGEYLDLQKKINTLKEACETIISAVNGIDE